MNQAEENSTKKCPKCQEFKVITKFGLCQRNKDKHQVYCKDCRKDYHQKNREYIIKKVQKHYQNNIEKKKRYDHEYRLKNLVKIQHERRLRYQNNIEFKLRKNYSNRLRNFFHENPETRIFNQNIHSKLLFCGCTMSELKIYLEKQFLLGMTWKNYGTWGWHIDHIIPCSFFILQNETEFKQCFHYSNLRPLWRKENISKGNKLINMNYNNHTPFI